VTESGMVRSKTDNFVYDFADGAAGVARVLFEFRERVSPYYRSRNLALRPGPFFSGAALTRRFPTIADS
jgi:hypothetical protein